MKFSYLPILTFAFFWLAGAGLLAQKDSGNDTASPGKTGAAEGKPSESPENRELKSGDRLRYRIDEDPELGTEPMLVPITPIGEAHFKISRGTDKTVTLKVKGRRLPDVRSDLKVALEKDYYHSATVTLELAETAANDTSAIVARAVFFGEVRGIVPLRDDEKKTVTDAILQLGNSEWADLSKVRITRKDATTGKARIIKVNVEEVMKKGAFDKDEVLQDGDRVEVPQSFFKKN